MLLLLYVQESFNQTNNMQKKEDKRKYNGAKKGSKKTKLKYGEPLKKCTMEFPESKVQEIKTEIRKTILIKYIK